MEFVENPVFVVGVIFDFESNCFAFFECVVVWLKHSAFSSSCEGFQFDKFGSVGVVSEAGDSKC